MTTFYGSKFEPESFEAPQDAANLKLGEGPAKKAGGKKARPKGNPAPNFNQGKSPTATTVKKAKR
jgi:hypothetical protein